MQLIHSNDKLVSSNSHIDWQTNREERFRLIRNLYSRADLFQCITSLVLRSGGAPYEVKDIIQQAMIHFERHLREGQFKGACSPETYYISIIKGLCKNLFRKKMVQKRHLSQISYDTVLKKADDTIDHWSGRQELWHAIHQLPEKRRRVLVLWMDGYSMQEIASTLNVGNAANARKLKYRAIKQLVQLVHNSPHKKEQIKSLWKNP